MALKQQLLPDNIKQFEAALKNIGIDPDKDVDTLTFASFRSRQAGREDSRRGQRPLQHEGRAQEDEAGKGHAEEVRHRRCIYPMDGGFVMSFLDDSTLLFGDCTAIRAALDTRDGQTLGLDTNGNMADMMTSVDSAPVWSILDQQGTQNMMRSALGDASKVADYETVKKRLLGSRYTMNFNSGVNFDHDRRHFRHHDRGHHVIAGQGRHAATRR